MTRLLSNDRLRAAVLYLIAIALFHAPVVFLGKTLVPSMYQPHGVLAGWPQGYEGRAPESTFNIDLATPAYFESPVTSLVGALYLGGELPLWNPYQGMGMPLAAQYSSRAFFPYQVLESISPVRLWDLFMLGRPFVAAFFTFLFLSLLGLGFAQAFLGGLAYMLSGTFTWFVNLEQYANNAMMIPVHLYLLERLARYGRPRDIALAALSFGLVLLAGQPETALYALLLGLVYYCVRSWALGRALKALAARYAAVTVIGFLLAAPLVLPFLELMTNAHHLHSSDSGIATRDSLNPIEAIGIFTPTASEIPQFHRRAVKGETPEGEPFSFRIFPENGAWDRLGGYTGAVTVFLAFIALILSFTREHRRWLPYAALFFAFAAAIVIKDMGVRPFVWIGELPLFDLVWTQRWAGPVWVFSIAAASAIGLQVISEGKWGVGGALKRLVLPFAAVAAIFAILFSMNLGQAARIWARGAGLMDALPVLFAKEFVGTSFLLGSALTALFMVASAAALICLAVRRKGAYALVGIVFLELWWAAPRGYENAWLFYKLIPLAFGAAAAAMLCLERFRLAAIFAVIFLVSFSAVDSKAQRGLPGRHDPFTSAPYVDFLKRHAGQSRVAGGDGMLFPNFASALGVQDIRFISSLSVDSFHRFKERFLQPEENSFYSLWFTGRKTRTVPGRGVEDERIEDSLASNQRHYSFLGVRYLVMPPDASSEMPAAYEGADAKVFENTQAMPRAFVVSGVESAASLDEALERYGSEGFDAASRAVVEGAAPGWFRPEGPAHGNATITGYSANGAVIRVEAPTDGLLVLTDLFYPGWEAYVDGGPEEVYRVNGVARGVFIRKGVHEVVFRYRPGSFLAGGALFLAGIAAVGALLFRAKK